MKMSQKLIIVIAGFSLGACSMFEGENTFMAYQDLQDKVREHDEKWQSVQPKLERIDELEAEIASLKQQKGLSVDNTSTDVPVAMPSSKATMLTMDESMAAPNSSKATMLTMDESMAAPNVAPAVTPAPVREETMNTVAPLDGAMTNNELSLAASEPVIAAPIAVTSPAENIQATTVDVGYGVQVASYGNRDEAIRGWRVLQQKSPNTFDGLVPHVNQKEVKGRTMYQLKVGPFVDKSYSSKFCSMLKEQGTDCLVTKYDGDVF